MDSKKYSKDFKIQKRKKNVKLIRNDEKFGGFGNKEILNLIIRRLDGRK